MNLIPDRAEASHGNAVAGSEGLLQRGNNLIALSTAQTLSGYSGGRRGRSLFARIWLLLAQSQRTARSRSTS